MVKGRTMCEMGISDALNILNILRQAQGSRAKLADLLHSRDGGRIPEHTGAGIFGASIARLIDTGLIELYDNNTKNITADVQEIGSRNDWSLFRGYKVAAKLAKRELEIEAVLTERIPDLQGAIGLSVTQLLDDTRADWIRARPVFGRPKGTPTSDVFVLMPFKAEFLPIYDDHIKPVCERQNLSCKRADDFFGSKTIIDDVWELIANSKILVADCTDRNPNVFYELGIAHTLGKKVIIITQSGDDIPFDIRHIRYVKYDYTPRGMKTFESNLSAFIGEELKSTA